MHFAVGQKFKSKKLPVRTLEVTQVADAGRKAWVEMRDEKGTSLEDSWVLWPEILANWTLI
jgi:hypothetical protein